MKKLGLLGVVALMSASGAAHAVDTSMIKFEGNARLKYQSDNRVDYQNNRRYTLLRVRPGMTVTPNSKTSLVIVPQFAKALGEPTHISSSTTANTEVSTSGSSSLGAHGEFGVYEAYVGWQPLGWSEFYFGRQSLKYGDGLVIGQGNWGNHGRSFDALRARAKYGLGWSDLLFSKIKEYNTSDSSTIERGDKDLWALYSSWDLGQYFKNVDPYVFYQRDRSSFNSAVKSDRYIADHLWTVGARLRSDVEKFDYR
ncbi:MAG TPA: alginate export family protein, partial [Oligoflexia bacterium]|nr:alginate export family protein [Oligoflexia bacterium]